MRRRARRSAKSTSPILIATASVPFSLVKFRIGDEIGRGGFCMVHECVALDDAGNEVGDVMGDQADPGRPE